MGLKDSLITMIGDFVQLNRNPEFRSKSDIYTNDLLQSSESNRRHHRRSSLNINTKTNLNDTNQSMISIEEIKRLQTLSLKNKKHYNKKKKNNLSKQNVDDDTIDYEEEKLTRIRYTNRRSSAPVVSIINLNLNKSESSFRRSKKLDIDLSLFESKSPSNEIEKRSAQYQRTFSKSRSRSRCKNSDHKVSEDLTSFVIDEKTCDTDRVYYISSKKCAESQNKKQFPATSIPEDWEAERNASVFNKSKFISSDENLLKSVSEKKSVSDIKETIKNKNSCTRKTSVESMQKFGSMISPSFSLTMLNTNGVIRF